jgi:hypothetical protein
MDKACLEAMLRIRPDRGALMVAQAPAALNFRHDFQRFAVLARWRKRK